MLSFFIARDYSSGRADLGHIIPLVNIFNGYPLLIKLSKKSLGSAWKALSNMFPPYLSICLLGCLSCSCHKILLNCMLHCFLNTFFMLRLCTFPHFFFCLEVPPFPLSLLINITPILLVLPQILPPAWCCFLITPTKWHYTFLLYYEFKYNSILIDREFLESEDWVICLLSLPVISTEHLRQELMNIL